MPRWIVRVCEVCGGQHRSKARAYLAHNPNASAGARRKRRTKRTRGQFGADAERKRKGVA